MNDHFVVQQSVSPGAVKTEMFLPEHDELLAGDSFPLLEAEDVSQAVLYAISTPPHVQVSYRMVALSLV